MTDRILGSYMLGFDKVGGLAPKLKGDLQWPVVQSALHRVENRYR